MGWSRATAMVRYFMGGDEALNSDSSSRKAALAARWDVIQQRHERLIKHTFGAWTMRFFECTTLSEKYIYYWYSMERRSEEKHLMRILFSNLKIIASKHGDAAARNYLFGHWLLRLRSTLSPMDGLDTPSDETALTSQHRTKLSRRPQVAITVPSGLNASDCMSPWLA